VTLKRIYQQIFKSSFRICGNLIVLLHGTHLEQRRAPSPAFRHTVLVHRLADFLAISGEVAMGKAGRRIMSHEVPFQGSCV
ncbi:hypothetical protein DQK91_23380, partial [Oceanidesulfovibrio marinus]